MSPVLIINKTIYKYINLNDPDGTGNGTSGPLIPALQMNPLLIISTYYTKISKNKKCFFWIMG